MIVKCPICHTQYNRDLHPLRCPTCAARKRDEDASPDTVASTAALSIALAAVESSFSSSSTPDFSGGGGSFDGGGASGSW
jgi:hypothetical protein